MGHIDVVRARHVLNDGRLLFDDVSCRVGDGAKVALVGANGAGKTTLLRLIAGDETPQYGSVTRSGGLGVMRQFIGSIGGETTVRELLLSVAPRAIREAGEALDAAELAMMQTDDEPTQLRYAHALSAWGDAGGYEAEVGWDVCTTAALQLAFDQSQYRKVATLSGGEQKRLVLEALLRGSDDVLLLDEPDNYLDVPGKAWLEQRLVESSQSILLVSHDRELLDRVANRIVTIEGSTAWTHGGGFASYHEARRDRHLRLDELRRRWDEEHAKLIQLAKTLQQQAKISPDMASRYRAAQTRLERFEAAGPPPSAPPEQKVQMRLRGARTGVRAVVCENLELTGLVKPFDVEIFYGERVAVLGANGSGKSHFLRLLAGDDVAHSGGAVLGARVVPGWFAQTHRHPELLGRTLADVLWREHAHDRGRAMNVLRRYELDGQCDQTFDTLSGGQQARFQILLLEISGATLLLLDEPTDNLDIASAEALEEALDAFDGTVIAVTHDRWFSRSFERFLIFGSDAAMTESAVPMWEVARAAR
ncbi:MAG: ABC-F family ATP-binding cassette domain-containing protein [Acidothermaceae bacterium]